MGPAVLYAIMAASARSLMDDVDFVAALDDLEIPADSAADAEREPHWIYEYTPPLPRVSGGQLALSVLGFTLMMGLGAAGAALVFHERLALLLR
jgi:hypothetical protein